MSLIAAVHVRGGMGNIPDSCTLGADFLRADPNCMFPHPDNAPDANARVIPFRRAKWGPSLDDVPDAVMYEADETSPRHPLQPKLFSKIP